MKNNFNESLLDKPSFDSNYRIRCEKAYTLFLDKELMAKAELILDNSAIDLETVIKLILNRIVKDNSLDVLFSKPIVNSEVVTDNKESNIHYSMTTISQTDNLSNKNNFPQDNVLQATFYKMTKSIAIRYFLADNYDVYKNVTFASKNRSAYNYWANPDVDILNYDWSLILHDWINKKIYLFNIPANSIALDELTVRSDKPHQIDLQIMYNDKTFTDNRSGLKFSDYLVAKINY